METIYKGYGQDLYLFEGSGENIWDIKKNIGFFSTAMTDLFQKKIASNKWFYPVSLTLLACTQTLSLTKKIVSVAD
jgi:molybdate transport system ATP-binding protein